MTSYFNTTGLSGEELRKAVAACKKQEEAILLIYLNTRQPWTASQITRATEKAGFKYPIWSNRRAITNLMQKTKDLVKTPKLKLNKDTGKPEHFYALNPVKYPSTSAEQGALFFGS